MTVTTAGTRADATGQGSVKVKFVTKSGSNRWTGTVYEYLRNDHAEREHLVQQPRPAARSGNRQGSQAVAAQLSAGHRAGRPDLKNKAFFFVNYEEQRQPASSTLQRVVAHARGRGRHLLVQRRRRRPVDQPAAARGPRTASSRRSIRPVPEGERRHSRRDGDQRRDRPLSNPLVNSSPFQTPTKASTRRRPSGSTTRSRRSIV